MSSITTTQPPRFMDFYHRLFSDKTGFSLQIEQVTGFSDDVLYAIAQISTLANWKSREFISGRLSVRELIRRGDAIEQSLRRGEQEDKSAMIKVNGIELDISFNGDALQSLTTDALTSGCAPNEDIHRIIRSLFRETAVLYLHTVLSDPNPGTYLKYFLCHNT
jgi:C6 transcription factor Pro1